MPRSGRIFPITLCVVFFLLLTSIVFQSVQADRLKSQSDTRQKQSAAQSSGIPKKAAAHTSLVKPLSSLAFGGSPTLGDYANTSIDLSGNTTVTPDAAPTLTDYTTATTTADFKGELEADPETGISYLYSCPVNDEYHLRYRWM